MCQREKDDMLVAWERVKNNNNDHLQLKTQLFCGNGRTSFRHYVIHCVRGKH